MKLNNISVKVSEFFRQEYVDQASYDNLRKISSLVDGQKNSSRKIIHTLLEKGINTEYKVSQLSSKIEEYTEYLHGSVSGVLVNMGKPYAGTNNAPLIQKGGNFGTRYVKASSADRYINACGSKFLFAMFDKNDTPNLIKQSFEGVEIEPVFYVPTLPLLLINGSMDGVSSGFAQHILPRNPEDIKKLVLNLLDGGNRRPKLEPYFNGFNGVVTQGAKSDKQWLIKGVAEAVSPTRVRITEIPVGYELKAYLKVLDALEENKVITSYIDKSENDEFLFEVKMTSKILKPLTNDQLLVKLKLIKTHTENYTCMDEHNKIVVFDTVNELCAAFLNVKIDYMHKRKSSLLIRYDIEKYIAESKYTFIKMVTDDKLIISKRKKSEIVDEMDSLGLFVDVNGSYDYLLNMPITSMTSEKMKTLLEESLQSKAKIEDLKNTTPIDLLSVDINKIKF